MLGLFFSEVDLKGALVSGILLQITATALGTSVLALSRVLMSNSFRRMIGILCLVGVHITLFMCFRSSTTLMCLVSAVFTWSSLLAASLAVRMDAIMALFSILTLSTEVIICDFWASGDSLSTYLLANVFLQTLVQIPPFRSRCELVFGRSIMGTLRKAFGPTSTFATAMLFGIMQKDAKSPTVQLVIASLFGSYLLMAHLAPVVGKTEEQWNVQKRIHRRCSLLVCVLLALIVVLKAFGPLETEATLQPLYSFLGLRTTPVACGAAASFK